jgi:hypothetical protein
MWILSMINNFYCFKLDRTHVLLLSFLLPVAVYVQHCDVLPSKIELYCPEDIELVKSIVMSGGFDKIRSELKIKMNFRLFDGSAYPLQYDSLSHSSFLSCY